MGCIILIRNPLCGGLALVAMAWMPAIATAQPTMQWIDFPPSQSRLTFDAPGLSKLPAKAQEGILNGAVGRTDYVRRFAYFYPAASNGGSFATVVVFSVSAEAAFFNRPPEFDTQLTSLYSEFHNKTITWEDAEKRRGKAAIGEIGYRRFTGLGRSCVSFGGLFGASRAAGFENGGATAGNEQILGYYCSPEHHRLSEDDVQIVLSRLGHADLGKPQGPAPASFARRDEKPPPATPKAVPGLSAATPAAASPPANATAGLVQRPVIVTWEGHDKPIAATLAFDPKAAVSRLEIMLPGEARACFGVAATAKDRTGTWSVQCPSGAFAAGTFRFLGPKQGSQGEGRDDKGARIAFTVAGEP